MWLVLSYTKLRPDTGAGIRSRMNESIGCDWFCLTQNWDQTQEHEEGVKVYDMTIVNNWKFALQLLRVKFVWNDGHMCTHRKSELLGLSKTYNMCSCLANQPFQSWNFNGKLNYFLSNYFLWINCDVVKSFQAKSGCPGMVFHFDLSQFHTVITGYKV